MKGVGKRIFGLCADTFGLNKRMQGPQALVLRLHRVLPENEFDKVRFQRQHVLTEEGLDHLLTFLQRQYTLIQLDEYLTLDPKIIPRRERFACLTFDDGWQDNYLYAFPLLKTRRVPASIFLATGYVGTDKPFWWQALGDAFAESLQHDDKEKLLRAHISSLVEEVPEFADIDAFMQFVLGLNDAQRDELATAVAPLLEAPASVGLNWEQIRLMSASGLVRFGAQSWSHVPLPSQEDDAANTDIRRSFEMLFSHDEIAFNRLFCYPKGVYDDAVMSMVAAVGFHGAVTGFSCYASRQVRERYCLPRLSVTEALARDPSLFNYRLLKVGTQRHRLLSTGRKSTDIQSI